MYDRTLGNSVNLASDGCLFLSSAWLTFLGWMLVLLSTLSALSHCFSALPYGLKA
jgi:hypothetical protein